MSVVPTGTAVANNGITAATNTVAFTVPATAKVDNVALASIFVNGNLTMTTVPSGWNLIFGPINQAATACGFLYYKILTAGDIGAAASWVLSGSQRPVGDMETFGNVNTALFVANLADVTNNNNVASTSIIAPAVTTRTDQSWVVNFWGARVASQTAGPTLTVPGTHTALGFAGTAFTTAGIQCSIRGGYLTAPRAPGSYGTYTATANNSANYVTFSVPLPPLVLVFQPSQRRTWRGLLRRITRRSEVVQPTVVVTPLTWVPDPVRTRRRPPLRRTARRTEVIPPQVVMTPPVYMPQGTGRRAFRGWISRRSRRVEVVPPQVVVPPPAYVPQGSGRRLLRGVVRRGKRAEIVSPQVVVAPPAYVPQATARRALRGLLSRKPRRTEVLTPTQSLPLGSTRRTRRAVPPRRTRRTEVVPTTAAPVAPTLVHRATQRRTLRGWLRRVTRRSEVVPTPTVTQPVGPEFVGYILPSTVDGQIVPPGVLGSPLPSAVDGHTLPSTVTGEPLPSSLEEG